MKWSHCLPWKSCLLAAGLLVSPQSGKLQAQPDLSDPAPQAAVPAPNPPAQPVAAAQPAAENAASEQRERKERPQPPTPPPDPATLLMDNIAPISLPDALELAGVRNPDIQRARALTSVALANRFATVSVLLPNINVGSNFDAHTGNLQQSNGNIIKVNREALDYGLGTGTVAAGTASVPGINYNVNINTAFFNALRARQMVRERKLNTLAVRNQVLLRVALAYCALLRAEGRRAIAIQTRDDAKEVARITREQAAGGQAKISDAERAAVQLEMRMQEVVEAENGVIQASAELAQELNLDPAIRLHAIDGWAVPAPLVPPRIALNKLVVIALGNRPELAAQQAVIQQALLAMQAQKLLPFSPTLILGFSASGFGGGSNLAGYPPGVAPTPAFGSVQSGLRTASTPAAVLTTQERFGNFAERTDVDAIFFWTVQNLGVGNWALVRQARTVLQQTQSEKLIVLNQIRRQVAQSFAESYARFAQIDTSEQALRTSLQGFQLDKQRTLQGPRFGLPIETLDSLRLLADARYDYLDAIIRFNQAHFALYVALGSPPADMLARALPANLVPPPPDARLNPGAAHASAPGAVPVWSTSQGEPESAPVGRDAQIR